MRVPLLINALQVLCYGLGTAVLWWLSPWAAGAYVLFILLVHLWIGWVRCRHCAYFGVRCGPGLGGIAALVFRKGDPELFVERFRLSWPNTGLWLIPPVVGIALLFLRDMDWVLAGLTGAFILVAWGTRPLVERLACKRCAMREICPMHAQKKP